MSSVPAVPRVIPRPVVRNQTLTMYWMAPINDGGSPITGYTLSASGVGPFSVGPNVTVYTVSGLSANTFYSFSISAINSVGTGPAAIFRTVRTGARLPQAQTATAALTDVSHTALVSWAAPTGVSPSDITWYVVRAFIQGVPRPVRRANTLGGFTTLSISGLNLENQTHFFNVHAVSDAGYSPAIATSQIGGTRPFTPLYVSGNCLWMDAADITTMDLTGTTINRWRDKSQFNFVTMTNGGTVSLSSNALNNLNVASFSSSYMFLPIAPTWGRHTASALLVGSLSNVNTSPRFLSIGAGGNDTGNSSSAALFYRNTSGLNIATFRTTITVQSALPAYATPFLGSMVATNGQIRQALNGGTLVGSNGTNASYFNINRVSLGGDTNPANITNTLTGTISEAIVFNIDIPPFTRQKLEGYLAWKWGLQSLLPTAHPFISSAPTDKTVFTPTMFPGLQLWLDASEPTTLTLSGTSVIGWNDKSPASNATTISANKPTILYSSLNSNNTIAFNASSQHSILTNMSTAFGTGDFAAFVVWKATSNTYNGVLALGGTTTANLNIGIGWNLPSQYYSIYSFGGPEVGLTGRTVNTWGIQTGQRLSSVISGTYNGTSYSGTFSNTTNYSNVIGVGIGAGPIYTTGEVAEVLVYRGTISPDNRQTIEGYLAWKWGIQASLPDSHPYRFMNPSSNYTVSSYVPQNQLVRFTAASYSGSGEWTNNSPVFSTTYNAALENGTITKNAAGNGIVLGGSTNYRFPPNMNAFGSQANWSISVWFKRTGVCPEFSAIVANVSAGGNLNMFIRANATGQFAGGFYTSSVFYQGGFYTFPLNTWTHFCVTYDGWTMVTYINGFFLNSTVIGVASSSSGSYYRIGRSWDTAQYVIGEIGEVIVYNRMLSQLEVLQNFRNTVTTYIGTDPLLRYTASSWSGTGSWPNTGTAGTAYNAALNSGTRTKNAEGNGVVFNGSTSYSLTGLDFGFEFTVTFWFKRTGNQNAAASLFAQPNGGGGDTRTMINIISNATRGDLVVSASEFGLYTAEKFFFTGTPVSFPLNTWQCVTMTVSKQWTTANAQSRNYVNGVLQAMKIPSILNGNFWQANLFIGSLSTGANTGILGEIGELLVHSRILSETEIKSYFDSTRSIYGI